MTAATSLTAGAAGRYATALFELASEAGALDQTEADLTQLQSSLDDSADMQSVIKNPLYTRDQQGAAMAAICDKAGTSALVKNVIGLMAAKRRLFALPEMIAGFQALMADHRGELTAEVTAAKPMSDTQIKALADQIKGAMGKDVKLNVTVDDSIIGGLIVKVGSKMIDSSIRSRLNALQNVMKEAG
ncbi:MAG: F0F1 ATP synthase subunit delta [Pseudomonadota bacterium]